MAENTIDSAVANAAPGYGGVALGAALANGYEKYDGVGMISAGGICDLRHESTLRLLPCHPRILITELPHPQGDFLRVGLVIGHLPESC